MSKPVVKVGQVWMDNDKRLCGTRTLRVRMLQPCAGVMQWAICEVSQDGKATGRTTTIRLTRFRPNSTGYRLVSE